MAGIVTCKEILSGINELALLMVESFKDGVQITDVPVLISAVLADEKIKVMATDLFTKIAAVKSELMDLDTTETVELIVMEAQFVPQLIAAIKK